MRRVAKVSLGLIGIALAAPAAAITVYVRAAPYTETMPDGTTVTMWGYRVGPTRANALNNAPVSPGAAIRVPDNDTTLTVRLINSLPVPTSFVLHGHKHDATMTPVFTTSAGVVCTPPPAGTPAATMGALQAFRDCRVRSFTKEAAPRTPQNIGTAALDVEYTYTNVRPGTYLYQSGTMPQIQVQMGLYGVVRRDAPPPGTTGRSAYPGIVYDNDITLLLSEVDKDVHVAVAAGTFVGSTLAYDPKFFRLHRYAPTSGACPATNNGSIADCITQPTVFTEQTGRGLLTIAPGTRQLVRVVNAGIQSRSLQLIDGHWHLIAEDGNPFPYPREQYSAFLPAAKTADLWFTPTLGNVGNAQLDRQLTMFDRRMALTNNNADPSGGQLIRLNVSAGGNVPRPPIVSACALTATQGVAYGCVVTPDGNVASPAFSLDQAPAGMTIDAVTGAIAWTPNNDQAWKPLLAQVANNPVQVRVTSSNGRYNSASFKVVVTNVNDAPLAANDTLGVRGGTATFPASALLANDSDPDGDPLVGFTFTQPAVGSGTVTNNNGTLTYVGSIPMSGAETRTFTYHVSDGTLQSNEATVTLTVFANSAPVAVDDVIARSFFASTATYIDVLANDSDVDGNLNPLTLAIFGAPNRGGTANVVTAGCPVATRPCIEYTHTTGFRGTEAITYTVKDSSGATSNIATLRVNVE
jgi:hypothetical protein